MDIACVVKSKAERKYVRRMLEAVVVYIALVVLTTWLVRHQHVKGWLLYVVAVLPTLPVLRMLQAVALYVAEETDEFIRLLIVRSILLGAAAMMAASTVMDFLQSYAGVRPLPFGLFIIFWVVFGLAQAIQRYKTYKVGSDEEQA
jgi:hypothetical protein